jgi:glycosyltransferase involved in cell wall biosynthesis
MFLSPMCVLDRSSGAAIEIKALLECLAAAGLHGASVCATLFDTPEPFPLKTVLGPRANDADAIGRVLAVELQGVRHRILRTRWTQAPQRMTEGEAAAFLQLAADELADWDPDLVLSYGSSAFSRQLQALVRGAGRRFCQYIANATYRDPGHFKPGDYVICPSAALAALYRDRFRFSAYVLRTLIGPDFHVPTRPDDIPARVAGRRTGLIGFFNPTPPKGVGLVARLIVMAYRERPDMTFVITEGRGSPAELAAAGYDLSRFANVWWLRNQADMRRIYARTAAILMPSLWFEAAGRVAAEAQLSGIPVLATRRGGLPEQLNGGGFLFDPPASCSAETYALAEPAEARPWLETLARLLDDDIFYEEASRAALAAAEAFDRAVSGPKAIRLITDMAAGRIPPSVG